MRDVIASLVRGIEPWDTREGDDRDDVLEWIASGEEIFRIEKPATPSKHLVSYCVLVDTDTSLVFLVDHRDAQRWLPTGGHVEVGEHPPDAASREILEELGIAPPFHPLVGSRPLLVTVSRTGGRSAPHTDVSLWFVFAGSSDDDIVPDDGEFAGTRWWPMVDVIEGDGSRFDPNLPRFLAKLTALTGRPPMRRPG